MRNEVADDGYGIGWPAAATRMGDEARSTDASLDDALVGPSYCAGERTGGKMSSTASEERHRRVPMGVTAKARLIIIGSPIILIGVCRVSIRPLLHINSRYGYVLPGKSGTLAIVLANLCE